MNTEKEKRKKISPLISILIFLANVAICLFLFSYLNQRDTVYVAYVGPEKKVTSGTECDQEVTNKNVINSIEMAIEQYNDSIDIDEPRVELLCYGDENKRELARNAALKIATNSKAVAVLGHRFSSTSLVGSNVYREYRVPAITASATSDKLTRENDWYFRVIFNNDSQGRFLAKYAGRVFDAKKVSIVYVEDEYGSSLADAFRTMATNLDTTIQNEWKLTQDDLENPEILENLAWEILKQKDPGLLFFATFSKEGYEIIRVLKDNGWKNPILGGDSLVRENFWKDGTDYSEGIHVTSPLIFDVANEEAQEFRILYRKKFKMEPDPYTASYYDAAQILLKAIRETKPSGETEDLDRSRENIRDRLASFDNLSQALSGVTGLTFFDRNRDVNKPLSVGVYKNKKLISALQQLHYIQDLSQVENLEQKIKNKQVLRIGGDYFFKTKVVYSGIDINRISDFDEKSSSFFLDFYIWFRFRGEFDDANIEFINAISSNGKGPALKLIAKSDSDDLNYRAYHVKGKFRGFFRFQTFPFDEQDIEISFRHNNNERYNLIYVVDELGLNPEFDPNHENLKRKLQDFAEGWEIITPLHHTDLVKNNSTLGNPKLFATGVQQEFSRMNSSIIIKRDFFNFMLKNLFPAFVIILLAYLVFFIPANQFSIRISIGVNSIMTLSFFNLKLSNELPRIGYLVAIEYIFYAMYVLVLFGIFITIISHIKHNSEEILFLNRITVLGKIIHPLGIIFTGVLAWYYYF